MKIELELAATSECTDISIAIYCNNNLLLSSTASRDPRTIIYEIDDAPNDHLLSLVMTGKNHTHTIVDDNGNIVEDIYFKITKLEFDELDMTEIFCQGKLCYTHSFNSDQPQLLDEFYGIIGCNGTVNIEFSTPIYLWLLDYL
jgi:hypothetical protein